MPQPYDDDDEGDNDDDENDKGICGTEVIGAETQRMGGGWKELLGLQSDPAISLGFARYCFCNLR